jgi:hypothetical protein
MQSERVLKKVLTLTGPITAEHVKRLVDQIASIPNVQIWIEDNNEVQISSVPPIFKGMGSDLVTYGNGWLRFRKPSLTKYVSESVLVTIFYSPSQEKKVEHVLQNLLHFVPVLKILNA